MASQRQILEALAFAYSKAGGWWGQMAANAQLILRLSLWRAAIREGLRPDWAELVLNVRLPRHLAGCYYCVYSGQDDSRGGRFIVRAMLRPADM